MRGVKISLFLIFFSCFFCCNKVEEVYLLPERGDIADAIIEKVMNDEAMSIDGLNDAKPRFCDYVHSSLSKSVIFDTLQKDYSKIKFGWIITNIPDATVVCDIHWDSAWVDLKYHLRGTFKVVQLDSVVDSTLVDTTFVYDTNFVAIDSSIKSFSHTTHQKAIFLRKRNTNNAKKDWKLKYITPLVFESDFNSINIEQVSISSNGYPQNITFPSVIGEDPMLTFFNRDTLPTFNFNGTVSISVITQNSLSLYNNQAEIVLIHFGREINVDKKRMKLKYENSDSTHTGAFTIDSHGNKVYRLFVDLIDQETIFTSDGKYKSSIWMIPFSVP